MTLLEEYISEMAQDVEFDDFSLKETQMRLPAIKHKWVGRLMREKQKRHKLETEYDEMKRYLIEEAKTSSQYKLTDPAVEKAMTRHSTLIKKQEIIDSTKLIIELLEKAERLFTSMSFDIKNLIEIIRMETL